MINITDYKNLKKIELIHKELTELKGLLTTSIESLKDYNKYIPIMETLSVLHNSRTLVEINIDKFKRALDKTNG